MSTRERLPFAVMMVFSLFICAGFLSVYFFADPYDTYVVSDAEAGMRRNSSAQTVCAHLNSSTGADHTSGTVNVYYHNDSSFVSEGTATHASDGVWCYSLSANATNYSLVKVLWKSTGAITLLQTYPTTGYDDTGSTVPANVTHINGTAQSGGRVDANITHINGTAQSGGVVDTDTDAIADELETRHGTGPWSK